jgi:protein phosphatase
MLFGPDKIWGVSHIGHRRISNQDRYLARMLDRSEAPEAVLLAVADGMGGAPEGKLSAQILMNVLLRSQTSQIQGEQCLVRLLLQADKEIRHKVEVYSKLEGLGTTATIALIDQKSVIWAHVGDSRLYLSRNDRLKQISTDHRFIQDLLDDGTLSQEEARQHPLRNVLDQCVGCGNMLPESGRFSLVAGDVIMLCSDGLTRHVSDEQIQRTFGDKNARRMANNLLQSALQAGGRDNVTVLVAVARTGLD